MTMEQKRIEDPRASIVQYAVWGAPNHADGFELIGVFSKEEDARTFVRQCESSGQYQTVAPPESLSMAVILDVLARDRLRELAKCIESIVPLQGKV